MQSLFPIGDVAVMGLGVDRRASAAHRPARATRRSTQCSRPSPTCSSSSTARTSRTRWRSASRGAGRIFRSSTTSRRRSGPGGPGARRRMARYVDHVLALLPFEPEAHRRLGGPPCTYVGHPLIERLDELRPRAGRAPAARRAPGAPRAPRQPPHRDLAADGSRSARPSGSIAEARPDVEILLPAVPHLVDEIEARAALWPVRPQIVRGEAEKFAAFRRAHAALAASGTVTLELGLAGVPMVVAYRVDPVARVAEALPQRAFDRAHEPRARRERRSGVPRRRRLAGGAGASRRWRCSPTGPARAAQLAALGAARRR